MGDQGWTRRFYEKRSRPADTILQPVLPPIVETGDAVGPGGQELADLDEDDEDGMDDRNQKWVSAREFYAYRVQIRPISDSDARCWLWMFGKLGHQYVVDQWAKVESQKLLWMRMNQKSIRADVYQGVEDAVAADIGSANIGTKIILPSSFQGGPRYMQQLFQDSMAIVRTFGKPTCSSPLLATPNGQKLQRTWSPHKPQVIALTCVSEFSR